MQPRKNVDRLVYLHSALCGDDAIYRRFGERVETPIRSPHEIGLQKVTAVAIVLEFALVQLHREICCLEVQRHHLATSIPEHLRTTILLTD